MKKVLITGKNSYIGNSFEKWLKQSSSQYKIDTLDMRVPNWINEDFSKYDVVFHVAGIAHVSTDPKMEEMYYKINRDLTIDVAKKAKEEGVSQFIFMSSIIVYGDSTNKKRVITKDTVETPSNFYGDSKLQAEKGIKKLEASTFKVVIVRPPMIYGKESKGNYPRLSKLAKITPLFPNIKNERSMLHIDNLCEFLKAMVDNNETGIFFPQNSEYVNTSELVKVISEIHGKKILFTKIFNPFINQMFKWDTIHKLFGNLVYDIEISSEIKYKYQIRTFQESIELTESRKANE